MTDRRYHVIGIGNALVDVTVNVADDFLRQQGLTKGGMSLVEQERSLQLLELTAPGRESSGGSCGNSMAGLAALGALAGYIGRVRDDRLGRVFQREIAAAGVDFQTPMATQGPGTGLCVVMVTPDAERTMCTCLGAADGLEAEDIDAALIQQADILYMEGYLFDRERAKRAFVHAAEAAHSGRPAGRVALTLSDAFCVERHRESFLHLVEHHIDILFGNRQEFLTLYQTDDFDNALQQARRHCALVCATDGADGSWLADAEKLVKIPAARVDRVVDANGAGDQYAAGVLFGLSRGATLEACGRIGALMGAEVVSHYGGRIIGDLRQQAEALLSAI